MPFALAFAIGLIAGLRSLTAPAAVSWAARWGWLSLQQYPLVFLGSTPAVFILSVLAATELVVDKLPSTPNRTAPFSLVFRILTGGLSGAALCASGNQSVAVGAVLGAVGGVAGGFAGYETRRRIGKKLGLPGLAVALVEDAVAISGGFLVVYWAR